MIRFLKVEYKIYNSVFKIFLYFTKIKLVKQAEVIMLTSQKLQLEADSLEKIGIENQGKAEEIALKNGVILQNYDATTRKNLMAFRQQSNKLTPTSEMINTDTITSTKDEALLSKKTFYRV